jgi:hypothetical protein
VNERHTVEVPTGALIMYKSPVAFNMQLCMEEPHIAGVILQHAAEATSLSLQILEADSDGASVRRGDWNGVLTQGLRRMFPSFDTQTAHLQYPTMLQKLETLYFHGDEFHWVLARSPFLRDIELNFIYIILPDTAILEKNHALQELRMKCRSAILNPDVDRFNPPAFLDHFPNLTTFILEIIDCSYGLDSRHAEDVRGSIQGSYTLLIDMLQPFAHTLTTLTMLLRIEAIESGFDLGYLWHTLPSDGFLAFTALKHLTVPYSCLFGPVDPHSSPNPPPMSKLLPSSLETLEVWNPLIAFYDWLNGLRYCRSELPVLKQVRLECVAPEVGGDFYVEFAFESYPHPILATFRRLGVVLVLKKSYLWCELWDDYDIQALDLVAWQISLEEPISGMYPDMC